MTREEQIAGRMREARKRAGLSQEEVGRRLGITLRSYARWERVESHGFLGHLDEIAKAVETTPDELLGAAPDNHQSPDYKELADQIGVLTEEIRKLREDMTS